MTEPQELIAISALQHWRYCPRQCALIHLEQVFEENIFTLRGQAVHRQVDRPSVEVRPGLRIERALPIWSERLGLIGKADVVEFERDGTPYPVEYKHGSRRKLAHIAACDDIQLAAQAICLEEMSGRAVNQGALFYATSKRRRVVGIDAALRANVERSVREVRALLAACVTPPAVDDERCRACSLINLCQPKAFTVKALPARLLQTLFDIDA